MQGLTGRGILLLLAFVLQNSLLVLTMKYSFRSGAGRYHSSAVVTSEVLKLVTCVLVTSITRRQQTNLSTRMYLNMKKPLLVVASLLNVIQSNLQFAASCYLSDVSLFQRISTCPSRHSPCKTRAHRRHIQCNWGDQFKSASLTGGLSE